MKRSTSELFRGTFHFSDFPGSKHIFGTPGGLHDIFITKLPGALNVSERPTSSADMDVRFSKDALIIDLPTSAYIGYDLYSPDGRLIKRVSLGYLPAGRYRYHLNLPRGAYLLKMRVGERVKVFKGITH